MVTINGLRFTEKPTCCNYCTAMLIGSHDNKGWCIWFQKHKNRYDKTPARCKRLFDKAFAIGGDLVITEQD